MKKLIFIVLPILVLTNILLAQNMNFINNDYEKEWKEIRSLEEKGLPKSALEKVEALYKKAKADVNPSQIVKTLIYRSKYTSELEEDGFVKAVNQLRGEEKTANFPEKPVLQSMLGQLYAGYLMENQWRFRNRTTVTNFKQEDIRTWDMAKLNEEAATFYKNSLADARIKQVPIKNFDAVTEGGENTHEMRPTLYDFLAHRAIDYFMDEKSYLSKPAYLFEIDNEVYLGSAIDFLKAKLVSRDSTADKLWALKLMQEVMAFHQNDKEPAAFVDIDLKRLQFCYDNAVVEGKKEIYRGTLEKLRNQYRENPVYVEISYLLAGLYHEEASLYKPAPGNILYKNAAAKALEICRDAIKKFPKAYRAAACKNMISQITEPYLEVRTEDVNLPLKPILASVSFKNADNAFFKIIRVYESTLKREFENDDKRLAYFNGLKPLKVWSVNLPNEKDYNPHTTEVKIDKLTAGTYLLLSSDNEGFSLKNGGKVARSVVNVSNIAYIHRNKGYGSTNEFIVVDRTTGAPLKGVLSEFWTQEYNSKKRRDEYIKAGTSMSDSRGFIKVPFKENKYYTIKFIFGKDTLRTNRGFSNYLYDRNTTPSVRTEFFTDRAIYRPSQTIYFKAIVLQNDRANKYSIVPNRETTVKFFDVNGQEVAKLNLKTNEYGTCNGSFTAPSGGLLGQMRLQVDNEGTHYVRVEEYKRPKFEVKIEPLEGTYTLNQDVIVKGNAKSFAGSNIGNAQLKYRVTRVVRFPYWSLWRWNPWMNEAPQEIAHGEAMTDAQGNFTIPFKAIPNKSQSPKDKPVFDYEVSVDVTDITGETHSAKTTVSVGYVSLALDVDIPDNINIKSLKPIKITANNLNGQPLRTKTDVKIELLTSPRKTYISRLWDMPDTHIIAKADFNRDFPIYPYQNEDKIENWAVKKRVYAEKFQTTAPAPKEGNVLNIPAMKGWQPGAYRLTVTALDETGDTINTVKHFTLYDFNDVLSPINRSLYSVQEGTTFEPNDMVDFGIGTSEEALSLLFEIERKGEIETQEWMTLKGFKKQAFKITEADRGNIFYYLTYVKNNRFNSVANTIVVPHTNKELNIEYQSFRDKLQPGQPEEWRLKISGKNKEKVAAEMVAALYDASLDQFASNSWRLNLYPTYSPTRIWQGGDFGTEVSILFWRAITEGGITEEIERNYRSLNWFGFNFGGYMQIMMKATAGVTARHAMPTPAAPQAADAAVAPAALENLDIQKAKHEENRINYVPPSLQKELDKEKPQNDLSNIKARTNLNETVFFFPTLMTDADGNVIIKFTMNEALTRWKFLALAHSKDLKVGYITREIVTQKDLMVFPNAPRFLREDDKMVFSAKVSNISEKQLRGSAQLLLFDALTMQPIDNLLKNKTPEIPFEVKGGESAGLEWQIEVPVGKVQAVTYRVVAKAGDFSDGEENTLPVLTNRMLVTETLPLSIRGGETRKFEFKSLKEVNSNTLTHNALKLEFTQNPAWYAVQALPYLMEYPYECSEQIFSRYYANALATTVANSHPKIKQVFERWKMTDIAALTSNLSKNEELKTALLTETPWVLEAQNEAIRKKNVGLLFDLNRMANEQAASLKKLNERQLDNGGFAWFPGGRDSWFITQYIAEGLGHLGKLGVNWQQETSAKTMADKAIQYCDERLIEHFNELEKLVKEGKMKWEDDNLSALAVHYLYARSFYNTPIPQKDRVFDYYLGQAEKYWLKHSIYAQGLIGLALKRYGRGETTDKIVKSLKERAIYSEELGMYWKTEGGYWWYQLPIETHALMIELFDEVKDEKAVDDLKVWLLKNKQTNDWKTTKATSAAVYALLRTGANWLLDDKDISISLNNKPLNIADIKKEAGTGYFKTEFKKEDITPRMGDVTVMNPNKVVAWGAMYWQYFENLDKIKIFKETPLKMDKQLFKVVNGDRGEIMSPISEKSELKQGDKVKVRIELRVDRDMEYVHMKDMRASGFEPINVLSTFKWQGGLGYYESTRDAATNFFIDYLPKGTYVFEYPLTVNLKGDFSNGITTIQCMYAPEFTSHSEGIRVKIK